MSDSVRWDQSKFDSTLDWYRKQSRRTFVDICNTKAFFVAKAAVYHTAKANIEKMRTELGRYVTTTRTTRTGRTVNRRSLELASGSQHAAPLAALIINARLRNRGKSGLYGRAMSDAIRQFLAVRFSSIAFIKSGWIPAIKLLAPFAKAKGQAPASDPTARQVGVEKGSATPAFEGTIVHARIENHAIARHDKKNALQRFGDRGLQLAFDQETKSMNDYIEGAWKGVTDEANQKLK